MSFIARSLAGWASKGDRDEFGLGGNPKGLRGAPVTIRAKFGHDVA